MKNKKNRQLKKLLYIMVGLAIVASSLIIYFYLGGKGKSNTQNQTTPVNTINYSAPTDQDKTESTRNKNEIIQNMDKPTETTQSSGAPIAITLTRASRTNVGVYIEKLGEGYCDLKITQGGVEKISLKAKVIALTEYSTCEGFSLDSSKLDNTTFKINISVYSGDRQGSVSQEVN